MFSWGTEFEELSLQACPNFSGQPSGRLLPKNSTGAGKDKGSSQPSYKGHPGQRATRRISSRGHLPKTSTSGRPWLGDNLAALRLTKISRNVKKYKTPGSQVENPTYDRIVFLHSICGQPPCLHDSSDVWPARSGWKSSQKNTKKYWGVISTSVPTNKPQTSCCSFSSSFQRQTSGAAWISSKPRVLLQKNYTGKRPQTVRGQKFRKSWQPPRQNAWAVCTRSNVCVFVSDEAETVSDPRRLSLARSMSQYALLDQYGRISAKSITVRTRLTELLRKIHVSGFSTARSMDPLQDLCFQGVEKIHASRSMSPFPYVRILDKRHTSPNLCLSILVCRPSVRSMSHDTWQDPRLRSICKIHVVVSMSQHPCLWVHIQAALSVGPLQNPCLRIHFTRSVAQCLRIHVSTSMPQPPYLWALYMQEPCLWSPHLRPREKIHVSGRMSQRPYPWVHDRMTKIGTALQRER